MDDAQLMTVYNDPSLSPAEKLQIINQGGDVPSLGMSVAPTQSLPAPGPLAAPEPLPVTPAAPSPPLPMSGVGGYGGASPAQGGGEGMSAATPAAPPPALPPPAPIAAPVRTGPVMVPETTVTPGQTPKLMGGGKPKYGTPDWLRKYMGPETEGKVVQPQTLTVQPLSKEGLAAINQSETETFGAKRTQGEAEIQSQQDVADAAVRAANQQAMINSAFAEREHQRQEQIRGMEADYRSMADDVANTPITQPSMWGGEDLGSNILGRIALFLGTVGSSAAGTPNLVWEKMQRDIDRNLQVQKENRALKSSRLAAEGSLIDMARQRFQSEGAIDNSMRQSAYEKVRAQLAAYAEEAKTPERKAALDGLMGEVDKSLSVEDEQRRALMQQGELNERMARARLNAGPGSALAERVKQLELIARGKKASDVIAGKEDRADILKSRGVGGQLLKDAYQKVSGAQQMVNQLNNYTKAQLEYNSDKDNWKKRKRAESTRDEMVASFQTRYLSSSNESKEQAKEMFPMGGVGTTDTGTLERHEAAKERIIREADEAVGAARAAGLDVPDMGGKGFAPKTESETPK